MSKTLLTLALSALALYLSPGARSWFGGLLMLVGEDLVSSCPSMMTEEQKERVRAEVLREIELGRARDQRNGDRP